MKTIRSILDFLERYTYYGLLLVLLLPLLSYRTWPEQETRTGGFLTANSQIPINTPNYEIDVETWWAAHPFNPESSSYIPIGSISSPEPIINVKQEHQGDIQGAIEVLPSTGGTLYLEPGDYTNNFHLVGKSNVHFISTGGAVLSGGPAWIVGCHQALDYPEIALGVFSHDPESIACVTTNRIQNIYFKNITFDGGGSALNAMELSAANGVVFDNVVFQNFSDPGVSHGGLVDGNVNLDNIWFRGAHFAGKERWALYLDGAHFSGVVESQIDYNFGIGGLLFMTNDDLNGDYDENGIMEPDEKRIANYIVVANNVFGGAGEPFMYTGVAVAGSNILIQKNEMLGGMHRFTLFNGKCDAVNPGLDLSFYHLKVIGNTLANVAVIAQVDGRKDACEVYGNTMGIGKYTVWGNLVESYNLSALVLETNPPLETPNYVINNCINGKTQDTNLPCSSTSEPGSLFEFFLPFLLGKLEP